MNAPFARLPMSTRPTCAGCGRQHWQLLATESAARHCHMSTERFRKACDDGMGPASWAHEIYKFPRFHVSELDRWMQATSGSVRVKEAS